MLWIKKKTSPRVTKAPQRLAELPRDQPRSPGATKVPQGPSEILRGYQGSPGASRAPQRPPKLIRDQRRPPGSAKSPHGPSELRRDQRRSRGPAEPQLGAIVPWAARVPPGSGARGRWGGQRDSAGSRGCGQEGWMPLAGIVSKNLPVSKTGVAAAAPHARSPARRQPLKTARRCLVPPATSRRAGWRPRAPLPQTLPWPSFACVQHSPPPRPPAEPRRRSRGDRLSPWVALPTCTRPWHPLCPEEPQTAAGARCPGSAVAARPRDAAGSGAVPGSACVPAAPRTATHVL